LGEAAGFEELAHGVGKFREMVGCVVVADLAGGAVVATGDARDLSRLAQHAEQVVVADIAH